VHSDDNEKLDLQDNKHELAKYFKNTLSIGVFGLWRNRKVHFEDNKSYNKTHEPAIKLKNFLSVGTWYTRERETYDLAYFRINNCLLVICIVCMRL